MWNPFKKKEVSGPTQSEWDFYRGFAPYTPDLPVLTLRAFHLLFVYDRMQKGQADHAFFGGEAMELGTVFTKDKFALIKRDVGGDSYPIPLDTSPFSFDELSVRGEMVLLPTPKLIELDTERKNGVKFERRMVTVTLPYRRRSGSRLLPDLFFHNYKTWMYVGKADFWHQLCEEHSNFHMFDAVKKMSPNKNDIKEYYYFTKNEYEI